MGNNDAAMEGRLNNLLEANSEPSRAERAAEYKRQGKVIIGTTDANTPEEVIFAAGFLPWRVTGTWRDNVSLAHTFRSVDTDVYCNHLLQSHMAGELDFLDGVIIGCEDDDLRRLWDAWVYIGKTPFTHMLYVPHKDSPVTRRAYSQATTNLIDKIEKSFGVKVTGQALSEAIEVYNHWRTLMMRVYELRKRETPPLSGAEVLKLATASFVMPKDQFNRELEALLPYLENRRAGLSKVTPRLLVSGDKLDNPAYLELVESTGSLVAMDDLDTASRYIWKTTSVEKPPVVALAERYLSRPPCPHIVDWPRYTDTVIGWVKEYNIAGVLNLPHMYGYIRQMVTPYYRDALTAAGIPMMSFNIEYHLTNVEQLRTRIGAFIEMLDASAAA